MTDPNLTDFYGRVARIQRARAKGYGFEAAGTLGRSYYYRPQAQRRSIVGPILFLLVCTFLLKGAIYHSVGAQSYDERVASLMVGDGIEHAGGWLMQSEPATIFVSNQITAVLAKLM
jgi:hypothetical protein